ncbi:MBL fold metallo-hydrolase [Candidatus Laterigemmans baculatus]|uniref:MBL fold metallo-hydrolase n=1 Tax=Candidatus Laterigemmans baculatus TaxID=2770505 RepID=UPI0013DA015F|nr:MBL fold metallo-hydrolase [Candidatus Laterigemmans baculatus]
MRCRIHRGCHEIGGNCVEIEFQGQRIVLDVGLPLSDSEPKTVPEISGFSSADETLLGVFISHSHPDHYGFLEQIKEPVPIYMGAAARRIIEVSSFFTPLPGLGHFQPKTLADRRPIQLGPFTVTPFRIDHSAFDSYCLLIEAGGKRLLYTGDLRGHGRNAAHFEELVSSPPPDIDLLICEGTQVGRTPDYAYPNEESVAARMAEIFQQTEGMGLVWCSSQNIDRLVSVWEAAERSGRKLILDMYTAEIVRAADHDDLPSVAKEDVKVFLPRSQKRQIMARKAFDIPAPYYPHRIYPESLAEAAHESVMVCRPSMLRELRRANCLEGSSFISSLWSGYLNRSQKHLSVLSEPSPLSSPAADHAPNGEMTGGQTSSQQAVPHFHVHTSGHATVEQLERLLSAFPRSRVVPIHLDDAERFAELAANVELKNDLEWFRV